MMHMTFYWGKKVTLLFDSCRTETWAGFSGALLVVFAVAVFYQYMEDRRLMFRSISISKLGGAAPSSPFVPLDDPLLPAFPVRRRKVARFASAVLFGVNSAIGYLLMLSVMSFNGGVFIAVVLGLLIGYLVFRSGGEEDLITVENACACS